jgi:hypothetical protein
MLQWFYGRRVSGAVATAGKVKTVARRWHPAHLWRAAAHSVQKPLPPIMSPRIRMAEIPAGASGTRDAGWLRHSGNARAPQDKGVCRSSPRHRRRSCRKFPPGQQARRQHERLDGTALLVSARNERHLLLRPFLACGSSAFFLKRSAPLCNRAER